MAIVTIYDRIAFDLADLDLSRLTEGEAYTADTNLFRVSYGGGAGDTFTGQGLRYGGDGFPTGGEVFTFTRIDNGFLLEVVGLSIKAKALGDAAKTASTGDDRAVFKAALSGSDRFEGAARKDLIESYAGDDVLRGGGGDDTLVGGAGDDELVGGAGRDRLVGGAQDDLFIFDAALGKTNIDRIVDFKGKDDLIQIDNAVFFAAGPRGGLEKSAFAVGSKAGDASDRMIYDRRDGELLYDPDGAGGAKAQVFATIEDGLNLTHKHFEVI